MSASESTLETDTNNTTPGVMVAHCCGESFPLKHSSACIRTSLPPHQLLVTSEHTYSAICRKCGALFTATLTAYPPPTLPDLESAVNWASGKSRPNATPMPSPEKSSTPCAPSRGNIKLRVKEYR